MSGSKRTLAKRIQDAETRMNTHLADANEAEERGDRAKAERLYTKSQFWLDRYNKLAGNS